MPVTMCYNILQYQYVTTESGDIVWCIVAASMQRLHLGIEILWNALKCFDSIWSLSPQACRDHCWHRSTQIYSNMSLNIFKKLFVLCFFGFFVYGPYGFMMVYVFMSFICISGVLAEFKFITFTVRVPFRRPSISAQLPDPAPLQRKQEDRF